MPLNPYTTSDAKIFIAPATTTEPANAAAYAGLTWTEIKNIRSFSPFGASTNIITAPVVGDNIERKAAGTITLGDMTLTVYPDDNDAGQTALIAAIATKSTYPIRFDFPSASKVTVPGGTVAKRYWLAIVAGGQESPGGNEDLVTTAYTVATTTIPVKVGAT